MKPEKERNGGDKGSSADTLDVPRANRSHAPAQRDQGSFTNHQNHANALEKLKTEASTHEHAISEDVAAQGESVDAIEGDAALSQSTTQNQPGSTLRWVRLYNPLTSYFPPLNDKETDAGHRDDQSSQGSENNNSVEQQPEEWWQGDRSYFHDYGYHNMGASAMREMNLESLQDVSESNWVEETHSPKVLPKPIPDQELSDLTETSPDTLYPKPDI